MPSIADRLNAILTAGGHHPLTTPVTAAGWLDLAYEFAYADDNLGALKAASTGLELAADDDVDLRLSLLGVLTAVTNLVGEESEAAAFLSRRIGILRAAGRTAQAAMEEDLGPLLFREAAAEEIPLLQAALATHLAAGSDPDIIADLKLSLAVAQLEDQQLEQALPLLEEACAGYEAAGKLDSLAGTLMYLAHSYMLSGAPETAIDRADRLLALPANRALHASMWLLKGTGASEQGRPEEARENALRALELYSACRVRKGAVSAAAVVANESSDLDEQVEAVLAWKVAIQEAERGEVEEVLTLRLALGNQLMEAEEYELAEEVLTRLRRQLAVEGTAADRARCLMSLGHAFRHQERSGEALAAWDEAVKYFAEGGEDGEAARALLAAGTLYSREGDEQQAIAAYYRAVSTARRAADDISALPQALHALGHALCEAGDPEGVTHLDEAIQLAHDYGAQWHEADYSDTRARGLWALEHGPAAVSAALAAADLYSAADDAASAGNSELFAAYVLVELDRPSDAVAMFKMVLGQPESGVTLRVAANLGLAGALETLGLMDEARRAREAADEATD